MVGARDRRPAGPRYPEHEAALLEIRSAVGVVALGDLEGLAQAARDAADLPCDYPDPAVFARACGYSVRREPRLPEDGLYVPRAGAGGRPVPGTIYYRPKAEARREKAIVAHEHATALLTDRGRAQCHADIQRLAVMLLAERNATWRLVQQLGAAGAVRHILRRHRWAYAWSLRARIDLIRWAAREAAAAP